MPDLKKASLVARFEGYALDGHVAGWVSIPRKITNQTLACIMAAPKFENFKASLAQILTQSIRSGDAAASFDGALLEEMSSTFVLVEPPPLSQ